MVGHKTAVLPIRLHLSEGHGETTAVRIVGYRPVCSCDWRGPASKRYSIARQAAREHRRVTAQEGVQVS